MNALALEVRGLSKKFGALVVADDVDLSLAPGARHALIGPNGAGKTTLVNLLSGVLCPTRAASPCSDRRSQLKTRRDVPSAASCARSR